MYIKRVIEKKIIELSNNFPVVMLTGARQVGKTTILKNINLKKKLNYITLDYPNLRNLARTDPELFLQTYTPPIIIDEAQYAPELFSYIKIRVDENSEKGQYFLTGSQMFNLMQNVSESLAGRVGILNLHGFSRAEIYGYDEKEFIPSNDLTIHKNQTANDVFNAIHRGSMPAMLINSDLKPEDYYSSYVQTYIERDVKNLAYVQNEDKFFQFMSCLAARTSSELNLSDISKDVGIDNKTADRWISILKSSGIIYLLRPYSSNTVKRIVKRPKIYFMDTGLACYLSYWNNPRTLQVSAMAGAMFETYVVSEIIKTYTNKGLDPRTRLSYYRDNNKREIDLIISDNDILYPIEIKKSANPKKNAIKHFTVINNLSKTKGKGLVISLSQTVLPLDKENTVIPIGCI